VHRRFLILLVILGASLFSMIAGPVFAEESWKIYRLELEDDVFKIPYRITNANVTAIEADPDFSSMIISLSESKKTVTFEIVIPRNLIDSRFDGGGGPDDEFIILVDGEEEVYEETNNSPCFRTISVDLDRSSEEIEIIATGIPEAPMRSEVPPVSFVSDKIHYRGGTVYVSGCTSLALDDKELLLEVVNTEGKVYQTMSVTPHIDGSFSTSLVVEGELAADETYFVQARYAGYTVIPEFPVSWIILGVSFAGVLVAARLFSSTNKHNVY